MRPFVLGVSGPHMYFTSIVNYWRSHRQIGIIHIYLIVRELPFAIYRLTAIPIISCLYIIFITYILKGIAIFHTQSVTLFLYINLAMCSRFQYIHIISYNSSIGEARASG